MTFRLGFLILSQISPAFLVDKKSIKYQIVSLIVAVILYFARQKIVLFIVKNLPKA